MANSRFYSSVAVAGTLGGPSPFTSSSATLFLSTTPVGYPTSFPFTLVIDPGLSSMELVQVNSGAGTSGTPWNITRGFDGTTAVAHTAGSSVVQHDTSAFDFTTSRSHEALGSGSGVHGLPSAAWQTSSISQIAQSILSVATPTITFAAIPQTYRHLIVAIHGRASGTTQQHADVGCQLNGDSSPSYQYAEMRINNEGGTLSGPSAGFASGQSAWFLFLKLAASQAGTPANAGGGWAFIPNYVGTTFNKSFVSQSGFGNGTGPNAAMDVRSGWGWYNPPSQAGITSMVLTCSVGNFMVGTVASLYGLGS